MAFPRKVQRNPRFSPVQTKRKILKKFRLGKTFNLHTYNPAFCGLCKENLLALPILNNYYYLRIKKVSLSHI